MEFSEIKRWPRPCRHGRIRTGTGGAERERTAAIHGVRAIRQALGHVLLNKK